MSRGPIPMRHLRAQRRRLFLGCEGESEQGYTALLQRIADDEGLLVHLDSVLLQPGGGDPCAIIELAIDQSRRRADRRGDYEARFVLLDTDKLGQSPQRDNRGRQAALNEGLTLVWQAPCHEALLLRHLDGCVNLQPPTTAVAMQQLVQRWPQYRKAMAAVRLGERIDLPGARRVAGVDASYAELLGAIGLT